MTAERDPDLPDDDLLAAEYVLGVLPLPDRIAAVRGAYLDGLRQDELAQRFAVPLNTLRTWLRRGRISLRECMEK